MATYGDIHAPEAGIDEEKQKEYISYVKKYFMEPSMFASLIGPIGLVIDTVYKLIHQGRIIAPTYEQWLEEKYPVQTPTDMLAEFGPNSLVKDFSEDWVKQNIEDPPGFKYVVKDRDELGKAVEPYWDMIDFKEPPDTTAGLVHQPDIDPREGYKWQYNEHWNQWVEVPIEAGGIPAVRSSV